MANKEIADLADAGTLDGTETVHVVKSGNSRKTTLAKVSRSGLGAVDADITPDTDSTHDLGNATKAWARAYLDAIEGVGADTTIKRVGGTNSTPLVEGVAKAWCNFEGIGTISIRDSLNVSSLTDNGVGDYSVAYTNAMNSSNYCYSVSGRRNSGSERPIEGAFGTGAHEPLTTGIRFSMYIAATASFADALDVMPIIHGELA